MSDTTAPRPAATILLVRDRPHLEVLMVERHHQIDFASGALVFPGGKTSPEDHHEGWADRVAGLSGADRALRIAAIREAFEESGILLAARADGGGLVGADAFPACQAQRDAIAAGQAGFLSALAQDGLSLAIDRLALFAHWITPKGMPKRFDTFFYIAEAPDGQAAVCDGWEAVDAVWMAPREALALAEAGERRIIFPTRLNLQLLAEASSSEAAIQMALSRQIVTVEPEIVREDGELMLIIPPDAGYGAVREPLAGNG